MKDSRAEGNRWLNQAENDLGYAELGLSGGYFAQVCFQCLQVCEKALKAVHYGVLKKRTVHGHSLVELCRDLELPALDEPLRESLAVLDQYYIPTRYPNGLPGSAPYEVYTRRQAAEAVAVAHAMVRVARDALA